MFFLFKQKTAYEMRISDWSSDVCSSDLCPIRDADLLRLASLHAAIMVQFLSESLGQLQWNPSHRTRRIKDMFFLLSHSPLSLIRDRSNPQQRIRIFFQTYPLRERSDEHTSELQSLMRISYAVFSLKKHNNNN